MENTNFQSNPKSEASVTNIPRKKYNKQAKRVLRLAFKDRRLLLEIGDGIAVACAVLLALFLWTLTNGLADQFTFEFLLSNIYWVPITLGAWYLFASANDFYNLMVVRRRQDMLQRLVRITLQLMLIYLLVFFFSPRETLPRLFILYHALAAFLLISFWRSVSIELFSYTTAPRRVIIWGAGESARLLDDLLKDRQDIYHVVGRIHEAGMSQDEAMNQSDRDNFYQLLDERVSDIILANEGELDSVDFNMIMHAYERGVSLYPMPLVYETINKRIPVDHIRRDWLLVLPTEASSFFNIYPLLKRAMDIALALVGGLVFLLLLPFLAAAIVLDSKGGVFYSQKRIGLKGKPFTIHKLRTMVNDAEKQTGAVFAQKNDPRVTRVGRFLRRSRLDELPQVVNILRGEMSVIGPRPEREFHIERLSKTIPFYRTRLTVKPGLTGWAQVMHGYGDTDEDAKVKLEYDLYYIRNRSMILDLNIVLRTIGKVFTMAGQ